MCKFGVPKWNSVKSESWFYSWRKWRKPKQNNFEPAESEFKENEYDVGHPQILPDALKILEART